MYVEMEIPEIKEYQSGFPEFWRKVLFMGHISSHYHVNAITSTFMRLVESSIMEYRLGRENVFEFWNTSSSLKFSAIQRATSNFETCVTNIHRAIQCMIKLRKNRDIPASLKDFIASKPAFVSDVIANRVRKMRDTIHHLEGQVLSATVPVGSEYQLRADGPETPVVGEPGQTLKKIDRLKIGINEIEFSEIRAWILELAVYADRISGYIVPMPES